MMRYREVITLFSSANTVLLRLFITGSFHIGVLNGCRKKEAKKESFRKYLESSGVLDALTKVLVALYEQNEKPSSALEFVQQKLGGPSLSEHEKLQAEMSDLQTKYNHLLAAHQETIKELEELKSAHNVVTSTPENTDTRHRRMNSEDVERTHAK